MSTETPNSKESTATDQNNFEFENTKEVADTDLTAFQHNMLFVLRGCHEGRYDGGVRDGAYGLAIKRILESEEYYGEEINHGRLYPNLDQLVEKRLVEKGECDKRTNTYELTDAGLEVIATKLQRDIAAFKGEPEGGDGDD